MFETSREANWIPVNLFDKAWPTADKKQNFQK